MARTARERVHGPYRDDSASRHRLRWYVVLVGANRRRRVVRFATEAAADRFRRDATAEATDRTVSDAVRLYLADMADRGLKDRTVETAGYRLRALLRISDGRDGGALARLTPARAAKLLSDLPGAVVTRRLTLALARTWARWCQRQGWIARDPFAELEVVGRASAGKAQLRIDEARRFAAVCYREAIGGDANALAVLCLLVFGRRASEIADRQVRDLDDVGRMLWIPAAKTRAGRVQLEVPETIGALLVAQAGTRKPTDRLFPGLNRHRLHHHCERLCRLAGVTVVGPHSLRGLHATLARPLVSTPALVSAALGHASTAVTERHYLEAGAHARDDQRRAWERLLGASSHSSPATSSTEKPS